jgi:hypothetical protein
MSGNVVACGPQNAILANDYFSFISEPFPEQWFAIDFKAMRVEPTAYAIRSRHQVDPCCPRSWQILGSDDGETWEILDEQYHLDVMTHCNQSAYFEVATVVKCRFIKMKQLGLNGNALNNLAFSSFEVFGRLTMPETELE